MFRVLVEVVSVGDDKGRECEAAGWVVVGLARKACTGFPLFSYIFKNQNTNNTENPQYVEKGWLGKTAITLTTLKYLRLQTADWYHSLVYGHAAQLWWRAWNRRVVLSSGGDSVCVAADEDLAPEPRSPVKVASSQLSQPDGTLPNIQSLRFVVGGGGAYERIQTILCEPL